MPIHVRDVLQWRLDPKKSLPVTKWISEIAKLTAERELIEADYYKLRDEVKEAEQYGYGLKAGEVLREIHRLPAPDDAEPWC